MRKFIIVALLGVASFAASSWVVAQRTQRASSVSQRQFTHFGVDPSQYGCYVEANYLFWHKYDNTSLRWKLTILQGKEVVHDEFYEGGQVNRGRRGNLQFQELIPLDPGYYRAVLGVYRGDKPLTITNQSFTIP